MQLFCPYRIGLFLIHEDRKLDYSETILAKIEVYLMMA
jgi:hypothetical protein